MHKVTSPICIRIAEDNSTRFGDLPWVSKEAVLSLQNSCLAADLSKALNRVTVAVACVFIVEESRAHQF